MGTMAIAVAHGVASSAASRTRHLDNGQGKGMRECLLHQIGSMRHKRKISPAALASVEWIDSVVQFLVGRGKESGTTLHEGECEWGEWAGGWLLQDARGVVCGRVE
jgi:hypothetical protein